MCILTLEKVDSDQLKYVYQIGEHILGRGPELQCTSKKVSRKHALLKVTQNDGVFLESTHNNPCYHQSKNTQSIQIVSFSKSIKLNNEDKISLALDHGWFTAKISKSVSEEVLPSDIIKNKREFESNGASEAKKMKLNDDTNNENTTEVEPEIIVENDAVVTAENDAEIVKNEPLDLTENTTNTEIKQEPLDESTNEPEVKQEPLDESTNEPEVKQEPADTETTVKDEPEDDPKNNQKQDSNDPSTASTSLGNGSSRRDRCWYGSTCYRKNPTHRATFSHPNDADYDSDPNDTRAICCYGVNCYRRNRLHRERYRHPGQDKIPVPPSKKKRKQPKSPKTNETRKRKTKTVNYYDDDEDDYDLDDPFINDGDTSDEYEPESSDTESDEEASSQSQNTEELEDTKQLLKDARKFARR